MTAGNVITQPSDMVVDKLAKELEQNPSLAESIIQSLIAARDAAGELDPDLFAALSWPVDLTGYYDYLRSFARWAPQQSPLPAWRNSNNGSQEVYDQLCHFYFLIDQPAADESIVQDNPFMQTWLVTYADAWGTFLNTAESFNAEILQTFIDDSPEYRVQDSMINGHPNAPWDSFNDFFSRELNPGLRPIANATDNLDVACPADCHFKQIFAIAADSTIPGITLKGTHTVASVIELLEGSPFANSFAGGTFVHYFLGPYSYHRFHAPVSGEVMESRPVVGQTFLDVNLKDGQFDAPDTGTNGYEFTQARGILTIDTANSPEGNIGIVTTIPVGMCQVSSVHMTATPGPTTKGDEFGYFLFGGSDIIVLFQAGVDPDIITNTDYRHYGTTMATCQSLGG